MIDECDNLDIYIGKDSIKLLNSVMLRSVEIKLTQYSISA